MIKNEKSLSHIEFKEANLENENELKEIYLKEVDNLFKRTIVE